MSKNVNLKIASHDTEYEKCDGQKHLKGGGIIVFRITLQDANKNLIHPIVPSSQTIR